jgi:hypothetical protein
VVAPTLIRCLAGAIALLAYLDHLPVRRQTDGIYSDVMTRT